MRVRQTTVLYVKISHQVIFSQHYKVKVWESTDNCIVMWRFLTKLYLVNTTKLRYESQQTTVLYVKISHQVIFSQHYKVKVWESTDNCIVCEDFSPSYI